jgi:hypothetical protein
MPKQPPDYEKEFLVNLQKNYRKVVGLLDARDKDLLKKIKNRSKNTGYSVESLEDAIRNNEMFRSFFAKDPKKQKIHENIAAGFISSLPQVKDFRQLGHSELALFHGAVMPKKDLKKLGGHSTAKTIDFSWTMNGKKIYASHKYTKESGGAQDNQYADIKEFVDEANRSDLTNTFFVAIVDGDYYKKKDASAGTTKLEYLKRISNKRNVFAMPISELEDWLAKLT